MNGIVRYQQLGRSTAGTQSELPTLFTELLSTLAQARLAIEQKQLEKAHNRLILAQQVVLALGQGLPEEPKDLVTNLKALYGHCTALLGQANMAKSVEGIDAVLQVLSVLRDAWQEAAPLAAPAASPGVQGNA